MALINCPECGKQISVNAKKCIHCGFPIPQRICPQCGNEYNALLDECPTCGHNPVKAAKETERARKEQEEKAAEQKRLRKEKHDAWWRKYKWYVISAGAVLLCLLLALFVYMIISNNSDETPPEQEYVAEKAGANDTVEIDTDVDTGAYAKADDVYYPLPEHDAAWRKENRYLPGQIHDKDGYTNIREDKSTKSDIIGTLLDGEKILYVKIQGSNWLYVFDLDGAPLGYVHSSRVMSINSSIIPRKVPKEYIVQNSLILRDFFKEFDITMVLNSHCEGYYYYNARPTERHTLRLSSCTLEYEYKSIVLQEISPSGQIVGEFDGSLYFGGIADGVDGCCFYCTYRNMLNGETKEGLELRAATYL